MEEAQGGPVDPECAKHIGELGVRIVFNDELLKKAMSTEWLNGTPIPKLWGPMIQRNLSMHPATKLLLEGYEYVPPKPPSRWARFKSSLRSRVARWLHNLSEKFEECGYRDY